MGAVPHTGAHGLNDWDVARRTAPAGELHARPLATRRLVEILEITAPALVLGSAQARSDVATDVDVDVVRRRTGGGAVLLVPGDFTWIDVTIPGDDPLHDDDVARAFHWLGRAWAAALQSLGLDAAVHTAATVATAWSSQICFAGIGSGEVLVGDRKVVGLSQRRTRDATRFQSVVFHRWDPDALVAHLAIDDPAGASTFLHRHVAPVAAGHEDLVTALLTVLP